MNSRNHQELDRAAHLWKISGQLAEQADFLPPPELRPVREAREALGRALEQADGRLLAGLIGGTGVGKSSLISALAEAPISAASAIRPTTDAPVVYRHRDHQVKLPGAVEIVHNHPGLAGLALVDLPDFDSLETAHAETVLDILPELDLLIWITTPLKYADLSFYKMLNRAGRGLAPTAQVFVLNKIDQLLDRYGPERSPRVIADILADFQSRLREKSGFAEPAAWPLSALKARENPEELAPLRAFLSRLSQAKIRRQIEAANIERKADFLLNRLTEALPEEKLRRTAKTLMALPEKWLWGTLAAKAVELAKPSGAVFYAPRREETISSAPAIFRWAFNLTDFFRGLARQSPLPAPPALANGPEPEVFVRPWAAAWEDLKSAWPWERPPGPWRVPETLAWPSAEQLRLQMAQKSRQAFQKRLESLPRAKAWPRWLSALPPLLIPLALWAETIGQPLGPGAFMAALWRGLPSLLLLMPLFCFGLAHFNLHRQRKVFQRHYEKALSGWGRDLTATAEAALNQTVMETAANLVRAADQLSALKNGRNYT